MNVRLTQCLCCGVALSFTLLQASQLRAQNQPFQMAGLCEAPQGISLSGLSPHRHIGGGNILGPHQGAGTFQIVDGSAEFSFDPKGNLIAFTASFTSGPNGYNFSSREGTLATDYGVDPTGTSGVTGAVVITVLRAEGPVALVRAEFVANFEIDPAESTGKFAGASGRWIMDARSTKPFRLNLLNGTSEPFRFIWRSRPGTGSIEFN